MWDEFRLKTEENNKESRKERKLSFICHCLFIIVVVDDVIVINLLLVVDTVTTLF